MNNGDNDKGPIKPPEPGFYRNIPEADYHRWDAASQSRLKVLRSGCPSKLLYEISNPSADTADKLLGRLVHLAVLQPARFEAEITRYPRKYDGRKTADKDERARFDAAAALAGRTIIDADLYKQVLDMVDVLAGKPTISALLRAATDTELSGTWRDPRTGVICKLRLDGIAPNLGRHDAILDLKTCQSCDEEEFSKTIFKWGYFIQAAMYLDGSRELGLDQIGHFAIIAQEKTPPYEARVFRIDEASIDAGRIERDRLLAIYRDCTERDEWPGYPEGVSDIGIPEWAHRRYENQ